MGGGSSLSMHINRLFLLPISYLYINWNKTSQVFKNPIWVTYIYVRNGFATPTIWRNLERNLREREREENYTLWQVIGEDFHISYGLRWLYHMKATAEQIMAADVHVIRFKSVSLLLSLWCANVYWKVWQSGRSLYINCINLHYPTQHTTTYINFRLHTHRMWWSCFKFLWWPFINLVKMVHHMYILFYLNLTVVTMLSTSLIKTLPWSVTIVLSEYWMHRLAYVSCGCWVIKA